MSLVHLLSKFSQEAILIELFLIAVITTSYFGYLVLKKRRYGAAKKHIPDNVVRAFLIELISSAEGFKNQLFGENFVIPKGGAGMNLGMLGAQPAAQGGGADAAVVTALQTQLAAATSKSEELAKIVNQLTAEKSALEANVAQATANASAAAAGGGGGEKAVAEAREKITMLEAKLAEYEVIEDDLANLKRYQQENKQLRAQLDGAKGPGAAAAAVAAVAPATSAPAPSVTSGPSPVAAPVAKAPEPSPIAAAEEKVNAESAAKEFEGLVDKVEESLAPPAEPAVGASVNDLLGGAQPAASPISEAPAGGKPEKSDADLLNEFEKMLSS